MRETRPQRLHFAGVFAIGRRQRHAPGSENTWQIAHACERHHHRGKTFVARGDAQHTAPRRKRTNEAPKNDSGVIAIRKTVEHTGGSLRAAVTRIGTERCERQSLETSKFFGGFFDEETDLPVTGVKSKRDRFSVGCAHAAL